VSRPVQIRASYRDDAAYLLRLEEALSKDDRQTPEWRKEACDMARALSLKLLQAKIEEPDLKAAPKRNGAKKTAAT
jgi:hypothetical protein